MMHLWHFIWMEIWKIFGVRGRKINAMKTKVEVLVFSIVIFWFRFHAGGTLEHGLHLTHKNKIKNRINLWKLFSEKKQLELSDPEIECIPFAMLCQIYRVSTENEENKYVNCVSVSWRLGMFFRDRWWRWQPLLKLPSISRHRSWIIRYACRVHQRRNGATRNWNETKKNPEMSFNGEKKNPARRIFFSRSLSPPLFP